MLESADIYRRKYGRERLAREEAEHLLEAKSRELFRSRQRLDAAYMENMKFLSVLSEFASAITSITSEHDLVWYTAREVVGRLGFVDCVIYLYDEDKNCIVQRAAIAEKNVNDDEIINPLEIPLGKGITGSVAASRKAEVISDVSEDPRYIADVMANASEICVPMIHNDRLIGVIDSESPEPNKFTTSDLDILKTVAAYAAAKIDQIHAKKEAQQRTADLEKRVQELTELKEELVAAKEKAEETSALKSRFVATISHEIRTPLSGILGSLDLLQDEALADDARKLVSMAWASGQTLQTLLNDVIDFARTEAGTLQLEPAVFAVEDLIASIKSFWQPHVSARSSVLEVEIDEDVSSHYWGDPARIRQIMNNYISNAIKYAPSKRYVIKVQARPDGSLRWSVCDFGAGIRKEDCDQLFTQFTRVGANKRKIGEGAGLGLAICKQLASLMDGRVGVNSAPGIGATFWFEAPLDAVQVSSAPAPEPKEDRRNFRDRFGRMPRILVAEDVPTNQMLIRMSLEAFGCRVTIVNNGVEAVEAASNHTYDLIFMDIAMPEMDGTAATARILKLLGADKAPPIYALTAHGMDEDREEFAAAGMCGIVTKPFNREDLYAVVERAVSNGEPQKGEKEDMAPQDQFAGAAAFDVTVLDELMASLDPESRAVLLRQCAEDLRTNLDALEGGLLSGAVQQAAEAAHRIKSVSGTFGLVRVQHIANEANNSWQEGDADSCAAYCRMIEAELPAGIDILEDYAVKHGDRA